MDEHTHTHTSAIWFDIHRMGFEMKWNKLSAMASTPVTIYTTLSSITLYRLKEATPLWSASNLMKYFTILLWSWNIKDILQQLISTERHLLTTVCSLSRLKLEDTQPHESFNWWRLIMNQVLLYVYADKMQAWLSVSYKIEIHLFM